MSFACPETSGTGTFSPASSLCERFALALRDRASFNTRTGMDGSSEKLTHSARHFDDLALHVSDDLHELRLFPGPYLVLVQRCDE